MTPSTRIPPASASRYVPPQRPETPSPDASAREGLDEDASPLRDRKAIVTQTDEGLASRKRKREEDVTLPPDPYSVVREQKSKQSRHTLAPRSESPPPWYGSPTAIAAREVAIRPLLSPPDIGAAPALESDDSPAENTHWLHGELVSVHAGERSSPPIVPHTLLYEHAVYTENNETIAISTNPSQGVYADCISDELVWTFSSPQAVGLLRIRRENVADLDNDLPRGLAAFMTASRSLQGIRIQLGYSPQAYRTELIGRIRAEGVESTRTRMGLAASMGEQSVIDAAATHEANEWRDTLVGLASRWGTAQDIVELPYEAVHISQEGIDLFASEPYIQLPDDDLDAPMQ